MGDLREPGTDYGVWLDNRKIFLLVFIALALAVLAFAVGYVVGRRSGWVSSGEGRVSIVTPPAAATPRQVVAPTPGAAPAGSPLPLRDVQAVPAFAPATATPTAAASGAVVAPAADSAAAKKTWSVQVGAYSDRSQAQAMAGRLRDKGRPAFVVEPVKGEARKFWRVRVGPFPTRAAADVAASSLKAYGIKEPMVREE